MVCARNPGDSRANLDLHSHAQVSQGQPEADGVRQGLDVDVEGWLELNQMLDHVPAMVYSYMARARVRPGSGLAHELLHLASLVSLAWTPVAGAPSSLNLWCTRG